MKEKKKTRWWLWFFPVLRLQIASNEKLDAIFDRLEERYFGAAPGEEGDDGDDIIDLEFEQVMATVTQLREDGMGDDDIAMEMRKSGMMDNDIVRCLGDGE